MAEKRTVQKAETLLKEHRAEVIESLGAKAFDLLSPAQVRHELGLGNTEEERRVLPDLIRQGWLQPAPVEDIGRAHFYYRWRVEFIKQFKQKYRKEKPSQ